MAGLFHDCGIPLMFERFPEYTAYAEGSLSTDAGSLALEDQTFQTNHTEAGFLMAKTWHLPAVISASVREHHLTASFESASPECRLLTGVVNLAERIQYNDLDGNHPLFTHEEAEIKQRIFTALGINDSVLREMKMHVIDRLDYSK
jgi:HD-like signal output (HDOD) protein